MYSHVLYSPHPTLIAHSYKNIYFLWIVKEVTSRLYTQFALHGMQNMHTIYSYTQYKIRTQANLL